MNTPPERFSRRHGFTSEPAEIQVRNDAPYELRMAVVAIAQDAVSLSMSRLRGVVCRVLRTVPDPNNWSAGPVRNEVIEHVESCDWFKVYDIIEAIFEYVRDLYGDELALRFEDEINAFFLERGIGWQLVDGQIETRGDEPFEATVRGAIETLAEDEQQNSSREFHEALSDLSRRPDPDLTGAISHAIAGLECVMRDVTGDENATFGALLQRYEDRIPRPLDTAVKKIYGYASGRGRHVREGGAPGREETELVVSVAAAVATYLVRTAEE